MNKKSRGFTLIELLIVVAIIAILAAIAVPNFMEAQVRAKVSAVSSDLRTLATGMESYRIDTGRYPSYGHMVGASGNWFNELNMNGSGQTQGYPLTYNFYENYQNDPFLGNYYWWFRSFITAPYDSSETFPHLTTPVSYMTSYPSDPFAQAPGGPYGYQHTHKHTAWLVYSSGPRHSYSLNSTLDRDWVQDRNVTFNGAAPGDNWMWGLSPLGDNPTEHLLAGQASNHPGEPPNGLGANTYDPTNGTRSSGCVWRIGP